MKTKLKVTIIIILFILIGGEIYLQQCLGLAHAPLYYASNEYEYMAMPNQDGVRFGNHYHYNSYSQRSEEPDSTKKIILGLGDSVLFGGVLTDQDSIATSIFTRETGMQMLNISAGSWGPDNCAAYLREFGLFNAKAMFLLVSSHDAHDNMDFQPVVGNHIAYPNKQYPLAWVELIERYILPRIFKKKKTADPDQKVLQGIHKNGKTFNPGFEQLAAMAEKATIPLIVYLHADLIELESGKYNEQGDEIITWAEGRGIKIIQELDYHFTKEDYRDSIHINENGERKVAEIMKSSISESSY